MPVYIADSRRYNIPEHEITSFEKAFPDAKAVYRNGNDTYHIPIGEQRGFLKAYPGAKREEGKERFAKEQVPNSPMMPEIVSPYSSGGDYTQKTEAQKNYEERGVFEPKGQGTVNLNGQEVPVFIGDEGQFRVPSPVKLDEQQEIFRHGNPSEEEQREEQERSYRNFVQSNRAKMDETDKRLSERMGEMTKQYFNDYKGVLQSDAMGEPAYMTALKGNRDYQNLRAAHNLIEDARKREKQVRRADEGFLTNTFRSMGETAIDERTWDLGARDMTDAISIYNAVQKDEKGEELTDSERILLDAFEGNALVMAQNKHRGESGGELAGAMTVEMIPFIAQIVANPLAKLGEATSKGAAKAISNWLYKRTKDMANKTARKALRSAARGAVKFGAGAPADLAGGMGVAVTSNVMNTTADVYDRMLKGDSAGEAIAKGITSQGIEFASENAGRFFEPFFGGLGKVLGKGAEYGLNKVGAGSVVNLAKDYAKKAYTPAVKEFMDKTQWSGFLGEYGEELVGGVENALLVGDQTVSEVFSKDNLFDTAVGLSVASVLFPAIGTVNYGVEKGRQRKAVKEAEKIASGILKDRWPQFKAAINGAKNSDELGKAIEEIYKKEGKEYSDNKETQALFDYARSYYAYNALKGVDPNNVAYESELISTVRDNYQAGATMTAEELDNTRMDVNRIGVDLMRLTGMTEDELNDMDTAAVTQRINEAEENGDMDIADKWREFMNGSAAMSGKIKAVDDAINEQSAASDAEVDAITDGDGMIVLGTTRGGEQVYIIGGNVVLNGDNSVNKEGSSAQLTVVRDGKRTTMGIVELESVDAPKDAAGEKVSRRTAIEENLRRQQRIDMGEEHVFTPGEKFETLQGEVQFVADRGDGTADITVNGNATVVDMGTLNEQFNTAKQMEYNARKAEETSQAQAEVPQPVNDEQVTSEVAQSALQRVPKDEQGEPIYEQVDSDTAWDAIVEQTEGDEAMAQTVADGMVADKEAALKKLEKAKAKGGSTIAEKIAAEKERMAAIEAAKAELAKWKEIAGVAASRKAAPDINDASETETVATEGAKPTESVEVSAVEDVQPTNEMQSVEVETDHIGESTDMVGTVPSEAENRTEPTKKAEQSIEAVNKRKRQKPAGRYLKEDAKLGDYLDFEDYVMREIATGGVKFIWGNSTNSKTKGLAAHLGLRGNSERMRRIWMLDNKNGGYPEIVAYDLLSGYASLFGNGMPEEVTGMTDIDALDVLLEVLGAYDSPRAMFKAAQKRHNAIEDPYYDISEEEIEAMAMHMSLDEWKAYQEYLMAETEFIFNNVSDEELYSIFAEEYLTQDYERSRENAELQQGILERQGRESGNAESNTVLQGEQLNNAGEDKRGETAGPERNDVPVEQGAIDVPEASVFENAEVGKDSQTEDAKTEEVKSAKIEDIGEKIGGAKKDKLRETIDRMKADMEQSDETLIDKIAKLPISKIFNFDFQKLREGGMPNEAISFMEIVKKSIPAKPRTLHKVRRWVNNTLALYKLCLEVGTNWDRVNTILTSRDFAGTDLKAQFDAYMSVGGFDSGLNIGNAKLKQLDKTAGYYKDGKFVSSEGKWYVRDAGKHGGIYDTKEEAVEALKAFAGDNAGTTESGKKKEVKFAVYQRREDKSIFITIKGKSDIVIQDGFKSAKEAFDYIEANNAELQSRYRNLLDKTNADFEENRERKGRDYRNGKDITAEEFRTTFGFRGVEFGNWMTQEDRRKAINECYDALMDLAAVCKVSPKALSLNGTLGMAFGSRGGGKFSAHYEPGKVVINLTKTRGAGTLAHEWFHAIDNYFAKMGETEFGYATNGEGMLPKGIQKYGKRYYDRNSGRVITEEEYNELAKAHTVRKEMVDAWEHLMESLKNSDYYKRSNAYARLHNSKYWNNPTELGARAFSVWVENELSKQDTSNDYLANNPRYVKTEVTDAQDKYMPYPFDTDADWMDEAFGNLFEVMQERETEDGNVALYQRGSLSLDTENPAFEAATKNTIDAVKKAGVEVVEATPEMVQAMSELAEMQKRTAPETASVQEEHQPTVVSSADGAKVLKDLDSAIKEYENKSNHPKTLLGDIAKVLGAKKHGSNSQYATFEAVNGRVFTIRLANHNAKVSTFDNHEEDEGISIVVTAQENNGVTNDGEAHVVEFFYDAIKLRKADGKPLVEILKSIKQALYSGEYKDNTGLAQREEVNIPEFHRVFHGSGAKFDKFDHSHMGEGEGAQAYGWGTYVTEVEGIGKQYATAMRNKAISDKHKENAIINNLARQVLASNNSDRNAALDELRNLLNESWSDKKRVKAQIKIIETGRFLPESKVKANLYSVEIPDDNGSNYLHWEERINGEIQERIANGLQSIGFEIEPGMNHLAYSRDEKIAVLNINAKGKDLYAELSEALGGDKQASLFLNDMGFVGISYPAQATTGGRNDGARNYVIFNEADAQIVDHVQFLRTEDGTVYGWAVNGKIFLTPEGMNPNTPAHEYTHLWAAMVEKNNPKLWSRIVEAMKESPTWNEVLLDEAYSDIHNNDSRMASEVLSRLSGEENYRRAMERAEQEIKAADGIIEKAKKIALWGRIKQALADFWTSVKSVFGLTDKMPWKEFVNMALGDMYAGVNPNAEGSPLERMFIGEKGAANLDKAEEDINFRSGEGAYSDEEVAVESDPVSKVLGKPRFTRKLRREFAERERKRMRKAVDDVASALNTPIEMLESTEGLTGKRATAKGWYEKSTGKIVVVLPNNRSVADVMQTVLHEAVAHYGLRKLFGSGFDNFIDNIYNNVDAETRQKINLLASRNGWNLKVATEEYLASLAEDANFERVNPSIWQRIKSFFLDMLAEAGVRLDIELSDNELRYILWRSYQNLKYPGKYRTIADEARDIAKQGELKVGNYADNGTADVNVAEESDAGMVIGKENSISLPNNLKSKEDDIVRNEIQNPGRTQKIISGVRRAYDRAGRASHEANERVARSIRKANAEGQILAYNPLLRETLDLLRRQTDNEIYNDMLPAMERLRDRARNEQDRKDAESIIWLIKRFKNRNERGTIIRDLTGADLGEEIPLEKIDELFEMWNSDEKTAELYKRVRGFAEELAISFTFEELNDDDKGGGYTPSVNAIVFNAHMLYAPYVSQQRKASTIVHEIIHAVTCYAIAAKKNNIKLSPKLEKAAQTINDIYDNVVKGNPLLVHEEYNAKTDKMEPVADYGASSAYEMISELSNPEFVEKLKQIEYDGRSVWQRIWDAIKSIFVGKNETPSVYEQLSDAFDTIVENFDREAYERTKEDGYKFFNMISDVAEQEDDILFRSDEQLSAQQLYDKDVSGLAYNIKEGWVDRYSSLKAMMEAIKNETGKDIADFANIYYAMEHLSARNRAKMDVVMGQYVEPLMAMVNEFAKIGITQKELERYLNSKHGLERNREMAVADACRVDKDGKKVFDQKKFNVWETKRDAIYAQNMSWADTEAALDALARTFGVSLNKDYSGLTAIYKDREKGLSRRKAAYDAVVEFEKKAGAERIKNLWERVNDINNFSLDESFASGIMSKDTRDRLKGRYKYYVPLRGFNDKAVTEYEYLSSIDFPLQGINKAAHGRHSEATDIIPTMMNMMESAVVLGNKNRAKLALLHLAEQYPTKLLTVSNSWYSYNAVNDTWVPVAHPQLTPNMTPEQVADTVNQWEADMRDLEKQGKAKRFSSSLQIDKVGLETWKQDEHSVKVKRNGKEYVIWVNGNPKAAQAINGILGVQSQDTSKFFQWSERANRWRAKNITSRNPEFVLGNFARDIQQASKVSFIKYGFKYLKSFEANLWRHSIPKIHKLYYLYGKGKLNMNDPVHRMFNEFMQAGSETGFVTMMSIEDYQKKIDKLVSPTLLDKVGKPINVAVDAFGTATELANRGVENACRFAAFMTSRKMGHSLLESVNDAKEVTINFDRKGSGAYGNMEARQMKMFLNPTIQGLAQQITLIQKYPARAIPVTMAELAMGYFAGKVAIYLFNWVASLFTGDDDEKYNYSYYNIPEFVRRNNLIIPTGRGVNDYVVIPLSHEQRVAYGVGEILGAFKSGHMDSKDVAVSLIAQAAQALPMNPFDAEAFIDPNRSVWENFLKTVSPDILVPGLEALFFNENFAGMRVTNQSDFNKHLPEYKRALKNTPKYMVELSKIINEATGGTSGKKGWADSPYTNNPAVWDHLAKAYLGGMYSFPSKISKTILGYGFDDDDFREPKNWPIIGKFYMDTSNYEQNPEERTRRDYENAFYKFKDEYGAAAKELTTYKKEITSSDEEVAKEARENLKSFEESKRNGRFVGYFKQVEKVEKNLKEALDKAREFKDKELEDELEQRLILLKKEAVKYVETQDELYDMK